MAVNYEQVSSHTQDELRGTNRLVPIRVVAFTTIPNGIYAEYRMNLSLISAISIGSILEVIALSIEDVAGREDVAAMSYLQDVNAAGQLVDLFEIVVQSTSGLSTETHDYPIGSLVALAAGTSTSTREPSLNSIVQRLDAIEAL